MKKLLLFICIPFFACHAIKPASAPLSLEGHEWKLVAINHRLISSKSAFLKFDKKDLEVTGKAFCNTIKADYGLMGSNQLTFEAINSTKMYCDGVMDLEGLMITNMQNVKHYEIKNGMLYLTTASDEVLLKFKK